MGFGLCCISLWRHQGDFAGDAMNLGLVPLFRRLTVDPQNIDVGRDSAIRLLESFDGLPFILCRLVIGSLDRHSLN
jgi:hypothetical protein